MFTCVDELSVSLPEPYVSFHGSWAISYVISSVGRSDIRMFL